MRFVLAREGRCADTVHHNDATPPMTAADPTYGVRSAAMGHPLRT
jgi:hypothetical protein